VKAQIEFINSVAFDSPGCQDIARSWRALFSFDASVPGLGHLTVLYCTVQG